MRDLDAATAPFGLATTGGRVSTTGAGGFTLGGAMDRTGADYPVPRRHARWGVHPLAMWEDPEDDVRASGG